MATISGGMSSWRLGRLAMGLMIFGMVCVRTQVCASPSADNEVRRTQAEARILYLRSEIARCDELYFKHNISEISDTAYDQLKRELAALEAQFPVSRLAVTAKDMGDDHTDGFAKSAHRERMLSLEKAYSESELKGFIRRLGLSLSRTDLVFVIEPKYDGLAISATYEKGQLTRVVTRGNGREGDDVTANALKIANLPHRLLVANATELTVNIPALIELRGEVFISFAEFARLNRERAAAGESLFSNPRNLASGTLKQLDSEVVAQRKLEVVFYGIGACEPVTNAPETQQALHTFIRAVGLPDVAAYQIGHDEEQVWRAVAKVGAQRASFAFPTDGAVVKLDSRKLQSELGASERAPRWAIAYKFVSEQTATRLLAITWQVGRLGVLTPVAELAEVEITGSKITRATLHNRAEIERLDLREGDFVFLKKAGEIIPAIIGVDLSRRSGTPARYQSPSVCPSCGHAVRLREETVEITCGNLECPAQVRARLLHFVSRECVGITGLGEATLDALIATGRVRSPADLYRITRDELRAVLSEKTGDKLWAAIEASRQAQLWRFIFGLSIPDVGVGASKTLAKHFTSVDALARATQADFAWCEHGAPAERLSVAQIGSLLKFFEAAKNRDAVLELANVLRSTEVKTR